MYMASNTGGDSASRLPVIRADAIDPASPFTAARMRLSIPSRIASTAVARRAAAPARRAPAAHRSFPARGRWRRSAENKEREQNHKHPEETGTPADWSPPSEEKK